MNLDRRSFALGAGATALAFTGLARRASAAAETYRNEAAGYGPLAKDPAGYLDLPRGFSYTVVSRAGETMDDGLRVPDNFDGMGCFALPGGKLALVRNHELSLGKGEARSATGGAPELEALLVGQPHFARAGGASGKVMPGGTTTLVVDARTGQRTDEFLSLAGTATNCAGGVTPWGSWLTCEETVLAQPGSTRAHGWVFEVPAAATSPVQPVPLVAMGRFRHEAAAVDRRTGIVYQTEDQADGLFYRFIPKVPGKLAEGGRLQALAWADPALAADSRNWTAADLPVRALRATRWIDLDAVESPLDDLRHRGNAAGAVRFARGEGIHLSTGRDGISFYFTCTSGGRAKLGQIFRYRPGRGADNGGTLELFVESTDPTVFDYGDNLTVAPNGHLVVCEDRSDGEPNHLRGVTPQGRLYTIARLNVDTELAGACFSPDGRTLFVNAYSPGATLAIRGPWHKLAR